MIAAALIALLQGAPAAEAAALARLEPAFGSVIVSTFPDGRTSRLLMNRDRTYRYIGRRGGPTSGTWSLNGARTQVCLKQRQPPSLPYSFCTPIPDGPTWTAKAIDGEMVRLHLAPGRAG